MKRKWYRMNETEFEEGDYHIWGEKIGIHIAFYSKLFEEWQSGNHTVDLKKKFTHAMPFPNEPRKNRR